MNVDPNYLPAIPTAARKWIYFLYLLVLLVLNCIDAFWKDPDPDPWWLAGGLRVLNVIGLFIMGVVLAHTRLTVAEQIKKAEKDGDALPAGLTVVPESRAVTLEPGELGLPENLQSRPVTNHWDDDQDVAPH